MIKSLLRRLLVYLFALNTMSADECYVLHQDENSAIAEDTSGVLQVQQPQLEQGCSLEGAKAITTIPWGVCKVLVGRRALRCKML